MEKNQNYSVVILAAGLSERMGEPKMFLNWDKLTFIENIIIGYEKFGCKEIIVVLNERDRAHFEMLNIKNKGVKTMLNNHIEWGRFYSLKLGLSALSFKEHCFINNIDSPFVNIKVLSDMSYLIKDENYVVPVFNNEKGHPVLIGKKIINYILEENDCNINIKYFLKKFNCRLCVVDVDNILTNINTMDDYFKVILKFKN